MTVITSVLLLVWLTFNCQNCFAMEVQASSPLHATMDCCPDGKKQVPDYSDIPPGTCTIASQIDQPALSDEPGSFPGDPIILIRSVFQPDYLSSPSSGLQILTDTTHISFSNRLFSSYRILLI